MENAEIGARTGLGRLTNRFLSPAATDLAPQALKLLLRRHLLCEEHRLHALHQPLEPANELRFGDLKLGGGRGLLRAEG